MQSVALQDCAVFHEASEMSIDVVLRGVAVKQADEKRQFSLLLAEAGSGGLRG